MENNLEHIKFEEVVNSEGTHYTDFRKTLTPRYRKAWMDILKGWILIPALYAAFFYTSSVLKINSWLLALPFTILLGYLVAYLSLFIHEAGHFNLHPDKKINDTLSSFFLCILFGLSIKAYRKIHWQHHLHLGTPMDAEISYFNPLSRLFLIESLTGIHLLKTIQKKQAHHILTAEQKNNSKKMLVAGLVFHIGILTILYFTIGIVAPLIWITGFGIFFPFFATVRQILEHRDELADASANFNIQPHGKVSRLFVHTVLSSSFGSAGFTRHMIHHWDPNISYTRLADIETFLSQSPQTEKFIKGSRTTYRRTIKKLLAAS